jgi:hypothetical protein
MVGERTFHTATGNPSGCTPQAFLAQGRQPLCCKVRQAVGVIGPVLGVTRRISCHAAPTASSHGTPSPMSTSGHRHPGHVLAEHLDEKGVALVIPVNRTCSPSKRKYQCVRGHRGRHVQGMTPSRLLKSPLLVRKRSLIR